MKHSKNRNTLFFLQLFTTVQHEKILKEHSLSVHVLKKDEKQQVLGVLYHNIY